MNTCCIISKVHPVSVRKGLFAGEVSEHQHLVSLINFKTVWQPQCILAILAGWFIRGPSTCFPCKLITDAAVVIPKAHPVSVRKGLFAGVVSEHQHLV